MTRNFGAIGTAPKWPASLPRSRTIGEGIVGIAPSARLLIFKACWQAREGVDDARCNSFTLARALAAAFAAHAQVINLSLAGPDDRLLGDLIREGQRRGVLFVGAATDAAEGSKWPAAAKPGVIEVASAESAGSALGTVLYAPGREILTLLPGGHYDFASGASIATAQISGVVALMLAREPGLSAEAAYRLLRDTSSAPSHRERRHQRRRCLCGGGDVAASRVMSSRQRRARGDAGARSPRRAALKCGGRAAQAAVVGLRPFEQVAAIDGAHVQVQLRGAANRRQRHAGARRSQRPQAPIKIRQRIHFILRHPADDIAFANAGLLRRTSLDNPGDIDLAGDFHRVDPQPGTRPAMRSAG